MVRYASGPVRNCFYLLAFERFWIALLSAWLLIHGVIFDKINPNLYYSIFCEFENENYLNDLNTHIPVWLYSVGSASESP